MAQRTAEELESMLTEQVDYLTTSCALYDQGRRHEAKRLAVAIRVLVHDTTLSRSLLHQLGLKHRLAFLDTAGPVSRRNLLPLTPLLIFRATVAEDGRLIPSYEPVLYDGPCPEGGLRALAFDDWWTMMVIRDASMEEFSRRDLVLFLANKVGGAHVDPATQARLDALSRSETVGFAVEDAHGYRPIEEDPILPCMRQIELEVLEVLRVRQELPAGS